LVVETIPFPEAHFRSTWKCAFSIHAERRFLDGVALEKSE
jgi:hypothetical protein